MAKRLLLLAGSLVAVVTFASGSDSRYAPVGSITTGTLLPDAGLAPTNMALGLVGGYYKVSCVQDARVGLGNSSALSCFLGADGGQTCDLIRFSLGEKFYAKSLGTDTHVAATMIDAGVQQCDVFSARN